ncbi:MAG TPA: HTH-type transcriptional repressor FabR [Solimonas sp.]|nr:HTH-type transcriptional repressor FabR [Solimonas sp.]
MSIPSARDDDPQADEAVEPQLATRAERKERTRQTLLDAALALMGQGRSFTSLGLREITREAGVVPTSFYRHFRDLDELGLALVEEGSRTLRLMLRDARQGSVPISDIIRASVRIYRDFVEQHRLHFLFIAGERNGGSPVIRAAIRREVVRFTAEMAQDLRSLGFRPDLPTRTLEMVCGLVVTTMLNAASDVLDLSPGQPQVEQEMMDNFVRQLRLVFLGASMWREKPTG